MPAAAQLAAGRACSLLLLALPEAANLAAAVATGFSESVVSLSFWRTFTSIASFSVLFCSSQVIVLSRPHDADHHFGRFATLMRERRS